MLIERGKHNINGIIVLKMRRDHWHMYRETKTHLQFLGERKTLRACRAYIINNHLEGSIDHNGQ